MWCDYLLETIACLWHSPLDNQSKKRKILQTIGYVESVRNTVYTDLK